MALEHPKDPGAESADECSHCGLRFLLSGPGQLCLYLMGNLVTHGNADTCPICPTNEISAGHSYQGAVRKTVGSLARDFFVKQTGSVAVVFVVAENVVHDGGPAADRGVERWRCRVEPPTVRDHRRVLRRAGRLHRAAGGCRRSRTCRARPQRSHDQRLQDLDHHTPPLETREASVPRLCRPSGELDAHQQQLPLPGRHNPQVGVMVEVRFALAVVQCVESSCELERLFDLPAAGGVVQSRGLGGEPFS